MNTHPLISSLSTLLLLSLHLYLFFDLFNNLSLSLSLSDKDTKVVKMASGMSWFEGRLRKRQSYGEVTMEEIRSRQDVKEANRRRRRRVKERMHNDLYDGFNAEERRGRAVPAMLVQRREVVNQEENERDDGVVATMEAENQEVEIENEKQKEENQVTDQEDEGKIVIYYEENQEGIEIIDEENQAAGNQADNQERNNGINHEENKNKQGVIEVIGVDDEENKVETYEPLPAMFQVNEPELPENRYRYVGIRDWPLIWTYEERMMWGLGLGSASNPNVESNWFGGDSWPFDIC